MSLVRNKKATFDYEILDTFEAGIELLGLEVKSIKLGRGSLEGARVIVRGNEVFLVGFDLPPYQAKNTNESYKSTRTRRLLLSKKEIDTLRGIEARAGLTIVPISMYNKGRTIKLEIATARGKKKFDKREKIKKRESDRDIARTLKRE